MRRTPGFVVPIAVALSLLLSILIDAMWTTTAADKLTTIYEIADIQADYIAEAGISRVNAYLSAAIKSGQADFDRVLDPGLNTTCSFALSALTLGGTTDDDHLPAFSDATPSTEPNANLRFSKVPFAGGAYYVRIDDNSDDGHEGWKTPGGGGAYSATTGWAVPGDRNNNFPASTNNRETITPPPPPGTTGLSCPEADSPEIYQLRDNPVRDRDRIVLVTVISIFPGTTFANAKARRSYRLIVAPTRTAPTMAAAGAVTLNNPGNVQCGATGGIASNSSVTLSGCECGEVTAVSTVSGAPGSCPAATCLPTAGTTDYGCGTATTRPSAEPLVFPATNGDANLRSYPSLMNNFARTAAKECYFFMGKNNVGYFWDHNYTTQNCQAFTGSVIPQPCGTNDGSGVYTGTDPFCACWVPVFFPNNAPAWTSPVENPFNTAGSICNGGAGYCPPGSGTSATSAVVATRCDTVPSTDCAGNAWQPRNKTYDYGLLCGNSTPGFAAANPSWQVMGSWEITGSVTDADVPDGIYYVDGLSTGQVNLSPSGPSTTLTMRVVTPMQFITGNNVILNAPDVMALNSPPTPARASWAPDFALVSGGAANTLGGSASCSISGTVWGGIVCTGKTELQNNATVYGPVAVTADALEVKNNAKVYHFPGLLTWPTIPVGPLVWSEAAF